MLDLETNDERILIERDPLHQRSGRVARPGHVLYGIPRRTTSIVDVWVAPIDGSAPARIFLPEAESPIIVR